MLALLELLNRILAALANRKRERKQVNYEQDIQDIQDNPVDYARREYGGMRKPSDEQQPADVRRNETNPPDV